MLTLLERQPDLLRSQVGDRASDRGDLVVDRVGTIWCDLTRIVHFMGWPSNAIR
jgi:hypothetical protein